MSLESLFGENIQGFAQPKIGLNSTNTQIVLFAYMFFALWFKNELQLGICSFLKPIFLQNFALKNLKGTIYQENFTSNSTVAWALRNCENTLEILIFCEGSHKAFCVALFYIPFYYDKILN